MSFSIIACIGKNRELGAKNDLVFHFKQDMQFFRATTTGHTVLMGYNTWLSLGSKPLKGRKNYVLCRRKLDLPDGVEQVFDLEAFIKKYQDSPEEIFVIGGASVYAQMLPHCNTLYLTEVDEAAPEADVFFPEFELTERGGDFRKFDRAVIKETEENGIKFAFVKYTKKETK